MSSEKPRLNLELDRRTKERIDKLQLDTEAASITEVIRRAVRLYELVHAHNGEVMLRDKNGREVTLFVL